MCGISFISSTAHPIERSIVSMMEATSHRGPDHSAYQIINRYTGIAHNRLSIIDHHSNSNQPFIINDNYFLSFNGEIYNYQELRKIIKSENTNINFNTNSDTEVLMHLLILEGKDALKKLEGMYAFVFYDKNKDYLLAANDSFGIKPIYYSSSQDSFIISSESKPIHNIIKSDLNIRAIPQYLNFKYSEESTFYTGIERLNSNQIIERFNNQTEFNERPIHITSPKHDLKSTFQNTINLNCQSDSPLGISLSGGIDSTAILHQLHLLDKKIITCFYINCDDDTKELESLKKLTFDFNYHLEIIDFNTDFNTNFTNYLSSIDQPIGDIAGFLTYLVTKKAQELGVKTILSGLGADELFAGYNRHKAIYWHTILKLLPLKISTKNRLLNKLSQSIRWSKSESWDNFIRISLPLKEPLSKSTRVNSIKESLTHDLSHFLKFQTLPLTDQSSMINGTEIRVPFLNRHLLAYTRSKPASYFFKKGSKWELSKLFSFNKKTKKGFGITLTPELMKSDIITSILKKLDDPNHLFYTFIDYQKTQQLIFEQKTQTKNHSLELWTLAIGAYWIEKQQHS